VSFVDNDASNPGTEIRVATQEGVKSLRGSNYEFSLRVGIDMVRQAITADEWVDPHPGWRTATDNLRHLSTERDIWRYITTETGARF
jgi:hypothetical protein